MSIPMTDKEVPPLDAPYRIAPGVSDSFLRDGHVLLPSLATATEVAAYRPHILATSERLRYDTKPLAERDTYGKAFLQYWGLAAEDATVARFVFAQRFARVAAELLGIKAVRVYHDQALFKEAGGGRTPLHQDQHYWPIDTPHTLTMWMPLVPVTAEVGSMTFVSGSNRLGYLGEFDISDRSDAQVRHLIATRSLTSKTYGAMSPGDATLHAGWTLHSAPPNPSATVREVMTIIYFAADARVTAPLPHQQGDYNLWLKGLAPGSLLDGPTHPVVWTR